MRPLATIQLPRDAPSFLLQFTKRELRRFRAIAEIMLRKRFDAAVPFALRDMHELVNEQLAIAPAVCTDNNPVTHRDRTRRRVPTGNCWQLTSSSAGVTGPRALITVVRIVRWWVQTAA